VGKISRRNGSVPAYPDSLIVTGVHFIKNLVPFPIVKKTGSIEEDIIKKELQLYAIGGHINILLL